MTSDASTSSEVNTLKSEQNSSSSNNSGSSESSTERLTKSPLRTVHSTAFWGRVRAGSRVCEYLSTVYMRMCIFYWFDSTLILNRWCIWFCCGSAAGRHCARILATSRSFRAGSTPIHCTHTWDRYPPPPPPPLYYRRSILLVPFPIQANVAMEAGFKQQSINHMTLQIRNHRRKNLNLNVLMKRSRSKIRQNRVSPSYF